MAKNHHGKLLCFLLLLLGICWGCQENEPLEPVYSDMPIMIVNNRDYVSFLQSSIEEAEEYIHIIMYMMKYYPHDSTNGVSQLQKALIGAAARDIEVKVILEKSDYNGSLNETNESTFVYLSSEGIDVRFDPLSVTTHAKVVIIDDRIAFVGSSNWSISAFEDNNETNLRVSSNEVAAGLEAYFLELWGVSSKGRFALWGSAL